VSLAKPRLESASWDRIGGAAWPHGRAVGGSAVGDGRPAGDEIKKQEDAQAAEKASKR